MKRLLIHSNPSDFAASPSGPFQATNTAHPDRRFSLDSLDTESFVGSYQQVDSQLNSFSSSLLSSNSVDVLSFCYSQMFKPRTRASSISAMSFSQLLPEDDSGLADPSTPFQFRTSFAPDDMPHDSFHRRRTSQDQLYYGSPLFDLDNAPSSLDPFSSLDAHGLGNSSLHYRPQRSASALDDDLLPDSLDYGLASTAGLHVGEGIYPGASARGTRHNSLSMQPGLGAQPPYGGLVKGTISLRRFSIADDALVSDSQPLSESPLPAQLPSQNSSPFNAQMQSQMTSQMTSQMESQEASPVFSKCEGMM